MENEKVQNVHILLQYLDRLHLLQKGFPIPFTDKHKETLIVKTIDAVVNAINTELSLEVSEQNKVNIEDKIKVDIKDATKISEEMVHKMFDEFFGKLGKIKKDLQ